MTTLQRRLARLEPVIAVRFPPPPPPIDESLLSAEEWEEVARISPIMKDGGLAALSDAELDLMEVFARKLAGEEVESPAAETQLISKFHGLQQLTAKTKSIPHTGNN